MDRKVIAVLLAAALVMSVAAIGMAAAQTTTQKTEFNLDGWYETWDPATRTWTDVPAYAILTGNIKDKDGTLYLSPQTGTITIDGIENQIRVKTPKQSEPVLYYEYEYSTPGSGYYWKVQDWYTTVEVNIEGKKYIGWLDWGKYYEEWDGSVWDEEYSYLSFEGILDGKRAYCRMAGDFPING